MRGRHLRTEAPDITSRICGICPDRLPDQRGARHGGSAFGVNGGWPSARSPQAASTAVNGSRAMHPPHVPPSCSRLPRIRERRSTWRRTTARSSNRASASRRRGTRSSDHGWGPGDPSHQPAGRRVLQGSPPRSELEALVPELEWALGCRCRDRSALVSWVHLPRRWTMDYEFVSLSNRRRVPDRRWAASFRAAWPRHRDRPNSTTSSWKSTSPGRTHSIQQDSSSRGAFLRWDRSPGTPSTSRN